MLPLLPYDQRYPTRILNDQTVGRGRLDPKFFFFLSSPQLTSLIREKKLGLSNECFNAECSLKVLRSKS